MSGTAALERRFVTLRQAAQITGVSKDTLTRAIHSGGLKAKRTSVNGGKTLVRISDLDAWFDGLAEA